MSTERNTYEQAQQVALGLLRTWAASVKKALGFERILCFGSVVRGRGFGRTEGDIDLLIVWGDHHITPEQRLYCANQLIDAQIEIEQEITRTIFNHPNRRRQNAMNTEILDSFDLNCNICREHSPEWFNNDFIDLCGVARDRIHLRLPGSDRFRDRYPELVLELRKCQAFLAKYVVVDSKGNHGQLPGDFGPGSTWFGIPKSICRSSRVVRIFSGAYGNQNIPDRADALSGHLDARAIIEDAAEVWHQRLDGIVERIRAVNEEDSYINWTRGDLFLMHESLAWYIRKTLQSEIEIIANKRIKSREQQMLEEFAKDPIMFGGFNSQCQFFPESAMYEEPANIRFQESRESFQRIRTVWSPALIPSNLVDEVAEAVNEQNAAEVTEVKKVMRRGNSPFPRMCALPRLIIERTGRESVLEISLSKGTYHLALAAERLPDLPAIRRVKTEYNLNSLAVRVAYIYKENQTWYMEFQQRSGENATYKKAWDVAAAGYLDPRRHGDLEDESVLSIVQAARHEMSEEMKIPINEVPYKEDFYFFGVTRNVHTGQLDVLGYCIGERARDKLSSGVTSEYVERFERCELNPEQLVRFIIEKQYWVPTAILNVMFVCRCHMAGVTGVGKERLVDLFADLAGKIKLGP